MQNNTIKVLGISGSLRRNSYNKALLRAAQHLAPNGMGIDIYDNLGSIPPYNEDVQNDSFPDVVNEFKDRIRAADGILIVTPEYNYGIPGVLKNAIDWASRPYGDSAWEGKTLAIMGASTGQGGSVRAQIQLRHAAVFLNMFPLNRPEVLVANAKDKFDDNLNLTDAAARQFIRQELEAFVQWIERLRLGQNEVERVMERPRAV
ncbi:MAG: NAD(P)H-dependent oxidoreductase [SAR202 cluster bacterium]|nr:NAD(P)H-dependent oxidoreductase [SAR202 cluster bacterium]